MSVEEVELSLPKLHSKQQQIVRTKNKPKFSVICCGTKFGKTLALSVKAADMLFKSDYPIQILWAAPYFSNAKVGFKYVKQLLPNELISVNNTSLVITLKHNQAAIYFKGTNHDPEAVEGEMYHHVICDEASKMKPQCIVSIRTTTTATRAKIDIVSTPRGKNWFYEYFKRGQDLLETDYASYTYGTSANPFIDKSEIEIAQRQLPDRLFRQYYLAEFVDETDIFPGYQQCIRGKRLKFMSKDRQFWYRDDIEELEVVIGVDWAKVSDYTVFIAIDISSGAIVSFMRFQGLRYTTAVDYLRVFSSKFKKVEMIYHDKTGVGQGIDDILEETTLPYEGVTFTNPRKAEWVNNLIIGIERGFIGLPNWAEMIDEFEAYEVKVSSIGLMKYEAAEGFHDDIISAILLAWQGYLEYSNTDLEVKVLEGLQENRVKELDVEAIESEIEQFEALTV